jgi:hypothetical protein
LLSGDGTGFSDQSNHSELCSTNSWGINPAASIFVVKTYKDDAWQCSGVNGNQVSVSSYTFNLINYIFSLNLSAQSCYPTF